jgi:hypothetical protein
MTPSLKPHIWAALAACIVVGLFALITGVMYFSIGRERDRTKWHVRVPSRTELSIPSASSLIVWLELDSTTDTNVASLFKDVSIEMRGGGQEIPLMTDSSQVSGSRGSVHYRSVYRIDVPGPGSYSLNIDAKGMAQHSDARLLITYDGYHWLFYLRGLVMITLFPASYVLVLRRVRRRLKANAL